MTSNFDESYDRGQSFFENGKFTAALEEFESLYRTLEDPDDRAAVAMKIADCLKELGRPGDAPTFFDEVSKCLPKDSRFAPELAMYRACLLWHQQKYEEALFSFEELLREYKSFLRSDEGLELYRSVQVKRGVLLTGFRRTEEAVRVLEEALALGLAPEDLGGVLYDLGVCYYDLGKLDLAKDKFLESLTHNPEAYCASRAHYYLALIYSKYGAHAWALKELEICEPLADKGQIPRKHVFRLLADSNRALGLTEQAKHYEKLAR